MSYITAGGGGISTGHTSGVTSINGSGTFTTTSATYVDVTSAEVTITTTENNAKVLVICSFCAYEGGAIGLSTFKLLETSTEIAEKRFQATAVDKRQMMFIGTMCTVATAGSTTFKLQVKTSATNINVDMSGDSGLDLMAVELI